MAVGMRTSICLFAAVALCARLSAATVEGVVRDSHGRPAAAATVYLQTKDAGRTLTTRADSEGKYSFGNVPEGSYTLRAQASGAGEANAVLVLSAAETRKVDLTLQYAFYDEPGFIVAGVTDTMSRGGHGSDTVMRSAESLAKETAALSSGSTAAAAEEQQGRALEAVRQYQRAAELDPSEAHLFDWGAELLKHRAMAPATEAFTKGNRLYPKSLRMLLGLAAAWYARGAYSQAAARFFEACDLEPENPAPYMFLGKVQSGEIIELEGYRETMKRFAARFPADAWANYYYAVSLWKQRKGPEEADTTRQVRELLERAIQIDPTMGVAYLQLGIVYAEQGDYAYAITTYQKAIGVSPELEEAHYRLGQVYGRTGDREKARKELETYEQMSAKSAAEAQRQRAAIPQFLYELRDK
jgi:tetratricopeptide (TPR) repeat protein